VIEVSALGFRRGAREILYDVDFTVACGEFFAILGCNGAGKSTLLQLLSGDSSPTRGQIRFRGRDLTTWSRHALASHRAVLLQSMQVSLPFTASEIVGLGTLPFAGRHSAAQRAETITGAMQQMGITELAGRRYHTLSGGEQQRVQLARCLVQARPPGERPGLLLLDEPVAHLDPSYQHKLLQFTREFTRAGGTAVVVLHDLNLAGTYADRALLLADRTIAACGPPREVLEPALIDRVFDVTTIRLDDSALDHPVLAFTPTTSVPSSGGFHDAL